MREYPDKLCIDTHKLHLARIQKHELYIRHSTVRVDPVRKAVESRKACTLRLSMHTHTHTCNYCLESIINANGA